MAKSSGSKRLTRVVKNKTQVYNPTTGHFIMRNTETGQFIVKSDGKPFRGAIQERILVRTIPGIKRSVARKAEQTVIKFKNSEAA